MNTELQAQSQLVNSSPNASRLTPEQRHRRRLERAVKASHEEFTARIQWLTRQLARVEAELEQNGVEAVVNRFGVVQGHGIELDLACARFVASREALTEFCDEVLGELPKPPSSK